MGIIILNGKTYELGTSAITLGYNMRGDYCISKVTLNQDESGFYANENGIKIQVTDLNDFFIDNSDNRKMLRDRIKALK